MRQTSPRNLAIGYGEQIDSPHKTISEAAFSIGEVPNKRGQDRTVTEPTLNREEMSPQGGGFFMTQSD